ncbi:LysR family transcriptional regulator [Microbaculum marinum]|uniref:LysR family transcriptional regulator n=1 Tax=Microbaculum marinum TaxID=1764581 RepID=A0AAW9RPC5_9HYPH
MDIRHLRYFIAISEERSLSAASQRLGVAQPSLSQHVIRLEGELGVQLLVRSPRGIVLTEEGQLLADRARDICDSLDRCVSDLRAAGGIVRGTVAFGMPPSVSMVMSVPLAETIRVEYPQIRLQATEAMSGFIKTWIEDKTVDIGFLYDLDGKDHFRATHILDEELCFFSAPEYWPLSSPPGSPVALAEVAALDLILPTPSHGLRRTIEKHAHARHIEMNVVLEMDAMTQIKELAARGSGYTIFAPAAAHDFVARGELLKARIVDPVIARPVYLANNPALPMSGACRAVEQITLEVARELVRRGIWDGRLVGEDVAVAG